MDIMEKTMEKPMEKTINHGDVSMKKSDLTNHYGDYMASLEKNLVDHEQFGFNEET